MRMALNSCLLPRECIITLRSGLSFEMLCFHRCYMGRHTFYCEFKIQLNRNGRDSALGRQSANPQQRDIFSVF